MFLKGAYNKHGSTFLSKVVSQSKPRFFSASPLATFSQIDEATAKQESAENFQHNWTRNYDTL